MKININSNSKSFVPLEKANIRKQNFLTGFTLMEVIIVVVLISIIAAFAVPNYNKALQKSDEREAIVNLELMWEATKIYRVRTGDYLTVAQPGISDINQTLNTSIIESNMVYSCSVLGGNGSSLGCEADSPDGWGLCFHSDPLVAGIGAGEIYCYTGGCPSCAAVNCVY